MIEIRTVVVPEATAPERVDVFLAAQLQMVSRSAAQKLIKDGIVTINGHVCKSKDFVQPGNVVAFGVEPETALSALPEDLPLEIVYEDECLVVINKPQGMTTHPAPGSPGGTLVNALLGRGVALSEGGAPLRPGIVHRLDKDTSGLLVVAKSAATHVFLARQLADRTLSRRYVAVIWGVPRWLHARIDAPIGRHPTNRKKMAVVHQGEGRAAITDMDVLEPLGAMSIVRARLKSGRTHQIRVHSAYAGHPVVGDPTYGGIRAGQTRLLPRPVSEAVAAMPGQALHAAYLAFVHPASRETMSFAAPPPPPFMGLIESLGTGFTAESLLEAIRAEPSSESVLSPASGQ